MKYAGFWSRCGAYLIDLMLYKFFALGVALILLIFGASSILLLPILLLISFIFYNVGMEASKYRGTFGKMICGIEVVDYEGNRITLLRSLVRNFSHILSAIPFYLGFIISIFTAKKQTLHDFIAKTVVIKTKPSRFWVTYIPGIITLMLISILLSFFGVFKFFSGLNSLSLEASSDSISVHSNPSNKHDEGIHLQISQQYSKADYLALFEKLKQPLTDHKKSSIAGPLLISFTEFDNRQEDPRLVLSFTTKDNELFRYKKIKADILYVLSNSNHNIYNKNNSMEQDSFFSKLQENNSYPPNSPNINMYKNVYLLKNYKEEDIKGIAGNLYLSLPLTIKKLNFSVDNDIGRIINLGENYNINIVSYKNNTLTIKQNLPTEAHIDAYNKEGKMIKEKSHAWAGPNEARVTTLTYDEEVSHFTFLIPQDYATFPFQFIVGEKYKK